MSLRSGLAVMAALCIGMVSPDAPGAEPGARWVVAPDASALRFQYTLDGNAAEGQFTTFTGAGRLDPSDPESAAFELRIETRSIDLGNALVSAYATSAEWFDSRQFPLAVYRLIRLDPVGPDTFTAIGEIRLRGRVQSLSTPMTLVTEGDAARARGRLTVDRRDFDLGIGLSDLIVDVGSAVTVEFDLVARPVP
jgi:polyisoprenoid-binding protein YceI